MIYQVVKKVKLFYYTVPVLFLMHCDTAEFDNPYDPESRSFFFRSLLTLISDNPVEEPESDSGPLRIFPTQSTFTGDFINGPGGPHADPIAAADSFCQVDANHPGGATFLAFFVHEGGGNQRRACENANCETDESINWVLQPERTYIRPDGTEIMTTNAARIFNFDEADLVNSFYEPGSAGTDQYVCNLMANWTTNTDLTSSCDDWTYDIDDSYFLLEAQGNAVNSTAINTGGGPGCDAALSILCVEQP